MASPRRPGTFPTVGWRPAGPAAMATVVLAFLLLGPGGPLGLAHSSGTPSVATPTWQNLTPRFAINPGALGNGGWVYDGRDGYSVLFGGQMDPPSPPSYMVNSTWIFNGTWHNITATTGPAPAARAVEGNIAYDGTDRCVLLFGGQNALGGSFGDTWAFSAGHWRNLTPNLTVSPPSRMFASMVYLPNPGGVLMFGGSPYTNPGTMFNDTWFFTHGRWVNLSLSVAPSPRRLAPIAYYPATHTAMLIGGMLTGGAATSEVWEFHNGTWRQSAAATPPPRFTSGAAYDPYLRAVVVYGGCTYLGCAAATGDTWIFRHGGWFNATMLYHLPVAPDARGSFSSLYYPSGHEFLVYGGHRGVVSWGYENETWGFA